MKSYFEFSILFLYFSLSESECGGGGASSGNESHSPNSSLNNSMGIQFGTLWGGANGDMLAGMYGGGESSIKSEDMEAESNNISETSNDSTSNQVLMAS